MWLTSLKQHTTIDNCQNEIIMKPITLFYIPLAVSLFGLCACQTTSIKLEVEKQESRWFNVKIFEDVDSIGTSSYDLEFDISYAGIDGGMIQLKNCLEVSFLRDGEISEREFARWDLLKTACEAALRFYNAPETAVSYWPSMFDFSLLKTFPSTSIPFQGGQGLDARTGSLAEHESTLTLMESGKHSVKVSYDGMVVNYVEVARGDFNRDGYQDLFIRMDWYIEDTFGMGSDWMVITKKSPNTEPMMLWRK
ncbi:hypothetical protein EXA16_17390 [Vibrio cincinnatiensis]|uniref:hypothetical protein n=2 Tax=Vibrio cincinnatiensis TaxID=675 RepID=UPI001EDCB4B3|nr:hypothetical protein [Vibrio cincinnatiensis]MCG3738071.1 hypothetical protein [Vibrio cincinnatiensis]